MLFLILNWIKKNWLISGIVALGLMLRLIGLQFGKPFRYHPDELKLIFQTGHLLDYSHWSKETFFLMGVYPPFFTYVLAVAFAIYIGGMMLVQSGLSLAAVKELYYIDPFQYHLIARLISALAGTFTIALIYLLGKKMYSRTTGLIAAAFLAVAFVPVRNSHFGTVDIFLTALVLASFFFAHNVLHEGRYRDYVWAGIFAGLAVATKWNAALIIIPLVVAHFLASTKKGSLGWRTLFDAKLLTAAGAGLLSFLIASPLPLIDPGEFFGAIIGTAKFEQTGSRKLGAGGGFWSYFTGDHSPGFGLFYDNTFYQALGHLTLVLFSLGILWLLVRRKKADWLLLSFPILMYAFMGQMNIKAIRHLLPIMPFLLLIAAEFTVSATSRIKDEKRRYLALAVLIGGVILPQGYKSFRYDLALRQPDTRTLMKEWIEKNIAGGTKVGLEEFGPPLLSQHDLNLEWIKKSPNYEKIYDVYGLVPRMFAHGQQCTEDHNPSRHVQDSGIEIVVLDSFTQARYTWPYTQKKSPQVAAARQNFYQWVQGNGRLLHRVAPSNEYNISPELKVYRIGK